MGNFVNTGTLVLVRSGNDPLYPAPTWAPLTGPEYDAAAAIPQIYREWNGSAVVEADQTTKDAIDAAILEAARDGTAAQFDDVENVERAFALAVLDEINLHATKITEILDAIDAASNLSQVKTGIAAITDAPQRTIAQMKTAVRGKLGT